MKNPTYFQLFTCSITFTIPNKENSEHVAGLSTLPHIVGFGLLAIFDTTDKQSRNSSSMITEKCNEAENYASGLMDFPAHRSHD